MNHKRNSVSYTHLARAGAGAVTVPDRAGRGGRNRLHRLSASAAGLCQALRRGYLFKGLTVVLTDDIDADGAAASIPIFLGDFDGQGHKITGLRLTESCSEYDLFSRVESGASVRNLTVEGEVIPAGTQTDVGGIVGQMVPDITLRFSSGGLDELQTELNALQSLIKRTLDDAQSASCLLYTSYSVPKAKRERV